MTATPSDLPPQLDLSRYTGSDSSILAALSVFATAMITLTEKVDRVQASLDELLDALTEDDDAMVAQRVIEASTLGLAPGVEN